jgi:hypothetical protein
MNIMQCEFQQLPHARMAAALVAFRMRIFVLCLSVYLPTICAIPSRIGNGLNYFVGTSAFSGAGLHLADSLPKGGYPYV